MMAGTFREYTWRDIGRLIKADAGLKTEEEQRTRGEIWFAGGFQPPASQIDTIVRVQVYDKPFGERLKEHSGDGR